MCVCVCVNRLYLSDSASPLKTSTVGTYYRGPERALHRVFVSSSGYADQRTPLHVFRPQASVGGLLASPRRLCDVGTGPVRHDEADPRRTGMSPLRLEAWDLADVFASDVRRSEVELRIVAPPSPPLDWPDRVSFVVFAFRRLGALAAPYPCFAPHPGRCYVSVSYGPSPTARLQNLLFLHRFLGRNRRAGPLAPGNRKVSKVKRPACKKLPGPNLATTRFRRTIASFYRRL